MREREFVCVCWSAMLFIFFPGSSYSCKYFDIITPCLGPHFSPACEKNTSRRRTWFLSSIDLLIAVLACFFST